MVVGEKTQMIMSFMIDLAWAGGGTGWSRGRGRRRDVHRESGKSRSEQVYAVLLKNQIFTSPITLPACRRSLWPELRNPQTLLPDRRRL